MDSSISSWRGRRVLVTGCTAFLGNAVTRELIARGAVVVGLVRDRKAGVEFSREIAAGQIKLIHGRVEDSPRLHSAMAVHEVVAVFHLAADESGTDDGTESVLRAASLYHPQLPVIIAKPAGQLRLMREEESTIPVGIARFGELFGPGDRDTSHVVPRTLLHLLNGEHPLVSDSRLRDFVFVRDAARACLALAEDVGTHAESHDVTFRSGCAWSDRDVITLLTAPFTGKPLPESLPQPPENPLGWRPTVSLSAALGESIEWYEEFAQTHFSRERFAERKVA